jgi:MoaA/NifB/PqqE/SkfB family radical SAM enzyme
MSLSEIKRILLSYKKKPIVLFGGEPTVRDDLKLIIKTIKDSGNFPQLFTNGLKLSEENYLKELIKSELTYICLWTV